MTGSAILLTPFFFLAVPAGDDQMKNFVKFGAIASVLFLAGCGEGWEMRAYNNTPYGERTAGSGVEYVRANMMPVRGPVVKALEPKLEPVVTTDEPVDTQVDDDIDDLVGSGEKFFRDLQKK